MRAASISAQLEEIPVDFFGDPDGRWEYEELAIAAGFDEAWGQLSIGALTEAFFGFPEGAAVVMLTTADHCAVALVDCLAGAGAERAGGERRPSATPERDGRACDAAAERVAA